MDEHLSTARLTLRPLQINDAKALHAVFCDPEVMRYFDDPHRTQAQTRDWVRRSVSASSEITQEYVIVRADKVIGKAGIWKSPELGFLLRRDQWRKGFAFEALSALIPHLCDLMQLDAVTADVDPHNSASLTLLERLGFQQTGTARKTIKINGMWCDSIYLRREARRSMTLGGV